MATEKTTEKIRQQKANVRIFSADDMAVQLPEQKVSEIGFSTCVRAHLQNIRQGTVSSKGRSDVAYSNRKPWKQKGTGRARAGSARSPLWRGGGNVFGPQPRVKRLCVPKQIKRQGMYALFFDFLNNEKIMCADWQLTNNTPKTAQAYALLQNAHMTNQRIALFVSSDDVLTQLSFANIEFVEIFFFDQPNVYDLARNSYWLFLQKDFNHFKKMVLQWI